MADEETTNPLHEDFINSLPDDLKEHATPELVAEWDKYVQEKFTANAETNKEWEPYQSIEIEVEGNDGTVETKTVNIRDLPPEELAELLSFREVAQDEKKFDKWYQEIGKLREPAVEHDIDLDDPYEQRIAALEAEINSRREADAQREADARAQQSLEWVNGEIDKIKKDYPSLTDEHIDAICALAGRYPPSEDIVQKGFKDFQKLMGDAEKDFFKKKDGQPTPAERGGKSNTTAEVVTSYTDAGEAAKARIREALRQG